MTFVTLASASSEHHLSGKACIDPVGRQRSRRTPRCKTQEKAKATEVSQRTALQTSQPASQPLSQPDSQPVSKTALGSPSRRTSGLHRRPCVGLRRSIPTETNKCASNDACREAAATGAGPSVSRTPSSTSAR